MLEHLKKYDIVLASNSPRRRELLSGLGIDFRVELIQGIDETYPASLLAEQVPEYLARLKAKAYNVTGNKLLITADTIVILNNEILGKPHDEAEAHHMLHKLSGKTHSVVTGVTVTTADKVSTFSCKSEVEFAELSDEEIEHYINLCHPMDKAGGYGIQEWIGYMGIKGIKGSFYNVMGLPVQRLYTLLKTL